MHPNMKRATRAEMDKAMSACRPCQICGEMPEMSVWWQGPMKGVLLVCVENWCRPRLQSDTPTHAVATWNKNN